MGAAVPIAMGAAAAVKAGGSLLSGFGSSAEHKLQSALAARDAEIAARNAGLARQRSLQVAGQIREQGARAIAKTQVAQAAGNVQLRSATALTQVGGSAEMVELSARSAVNDGVRAALGYEAQRDSYMIKSQLERSAASKAVLAGILGAGAAAAQGVTGILSGMSSASSAASDAAKIAEKVRAASRTADPWLSGETSGLNE